MDRRDGRKTKILIVDVLFKPVDPHILRTKVRVFVQLDQTNRLLQEQMTEMTKLRDDAEAANVVKNNFLRNISHELRTPLSAVIGFADLMNVEGGSVTDHQKYLESIRRNSQQLLQIIDDVLNMSLLMASGQKRTEMRGSPRDSAPKLTSDKALLGKRILVVDDVSDNRVLVERYLTPSGVQVSFASGGQEAIEKASMGGCDLVLMDIQMPGMDGCEATSRLRAKGFTNPIVALTAHAIGDELERCLKAGCDVALTKPISKSALVDRLSQILL